MDVVNNLQEMTDHAVFAYSDEIIVELRGQTADGEFTAITYQFKPVQTDAERVQPHDSIDSAYEETVGNILAKAGYKLTIE